MLRFWNIIIIPVCSVLCLTLPENCRQTIQGTGYAGHQLVTSSGRLCQRWDRQNPHRHRYKDFVDDSVEAAESFCRNPGKGSQIKKMPWCYTIDRQVQWEYCDIPMCAAIATDCEDLKSKGNYPSGEYVIDPDPLDSEPAFNVQCEMTNKSALNIIQHNINPKTEVKNAPNDPNGLVYNISYPGLTERQLVNFIQGKSCKQFLRYDCHHSVISFESKMWAYWVDRNGNQMKYWPGGPPSGFGCACGVTKSCVGGSSQFCQCEKNDEVWRFDEGYITENDRLPVRSLYFSDTDEAHEMGNFTLGPLICESGKERNCQQPLGLENGTISDDNLSASSSAYSDSTADKARFNNPRAGRMSAWVAGPRDPNKYLQVDFGVQFWVTKLAVQGGWHACYCWTTKFNILVSPDGFIWDWVRSQNGHRTDFAGNEGRFHTIVHYLEKQVKASKVAFVPVASRGYAAVRVEIYGCPVQIPANDHSTLVEQGVLQQNTFWELRRSPYIIKKPLLVLRGVTLRIQAGVHVIFAAQASITIAGCFVSEGIVGFPVTFGPLEINGYISSVSSWAGIKILSDACEELNLTHVTVIGATTGIDSLQEGIHIDNVMIHGATTGIHLHGDAPKTTTTGIHLDGVAPETTTHVSNCIINTFTRYGIHLQTQGDVNITNTRISGPSGIVYDQTSTIRTVSISLHHCVIDMAGITRGSPLRVNNYPSIHLLVESTGLIGNVKANGMRVTLGGDLNSSVTVRNCSLINAYNGIIIRKYPYYYQTKNVITIINNTFIRVTRALDFGSSYSKTGMEAFISGNIFRKKKKVPTATLR